MARSKGGAAVQNGEAARAIIETALQNNGGLMPGNKIKARASVMEATEAMKQAANGYKLMTGFKEGGLCFKGVPVAIHPGWGVIKADFVIWRAGWPQPLPLIFTFQEGPGTASDKIVKDAELMHPAYLAGPYALMVAGAKFANDLRLDAYVNWARERCPRFLIFLNGQDELVSWCIGGMQIPQRGLTTGAA